MSDWEPEVERRDTSWLRGELATDFEHFGTGIRRIPVDSRYYLPTPDSFSKVIEDTVLGHRNYRMGRFKCQHYGFSLRSVVESRFGINSVGVLIGPSFEPKYNVIAYEDGSTEIVDPHAEHLVVTGESPSDHDAYQMESGILIL